MHSMRQRGCDIIASAVSAFLVMALLTAASTIARDLLLRPRPIVTDVRISGTSPLLVQRTPTLLSPAVPDAALYYIPSDEAPGTRELPPNIEIVDLADREEDTEEVRRRKGWQRQRVPPGFQLGVREAHRVVLYLSGSIDFSPLWDWNTKAVYISFIARFPAPATPQNDVVFLDAVMRPVSPPAAIARLAALRRQERRAAARLAEQQSGEKGTAERADAPAAAAAAAQAGALLTDAERQQLAAYEQSLRNREHDHPSVHIDHLDRILFLNESFKYFVDAFDSRSLPGNVVEVVLRYQVMSYSGWAPVREEVLGHRVRVQMPQSAVPPDSQRDI